VESLLDRLPHGSRIAVIRLRSLGDCVLTTPAISLLKNHRPDLKVTMIVEPRFAAIFEGNPAIDEIRPAGASNSNVACAADLALNLHGGSRSMWLTLQTRAKYRTGFAHHRYSFIYSHKIPRAQEILGVHRRVHTAEHLASAMFYLGVPQSEIPRAKLFADPPPSMPPYAVIHPFASAPDKTWRPERFIEVARRLSGLEPVFLAGPGDNTTPFESFQVWKNEPLARVKSLMSGASLFIGNDSGPAHIAAAFGVPVVVLFGSSEDVTWAPWRTESQVLTGLANVSCDQVLTAIEALKVRA
jgi:heptosyltransferase-3